MNRVRRLAFCIVALGVCSCAPAQKAQIDVIPLEASDHSAKQPGCSMPVLYSEPRGMFRKTTIIEGWGALGHEDEMLELAKKSACEVGADALLILTERNQVGKKKLLYGIGANGKEREDTPAVMGNGEAEFIRDAEHKPGVGEPNHAGCYVDAVAIVYGKK
jgi:hypothetical protein